MSDRDELARLMYVADNANQPEAESLKDWGIYLAGSKRDVYTHRMADAILAAGFRKPRTITTAAELDGLACGSVFRDNNERIWEVEKVGYGGVEKALSAMGIGSMLAFHAFRDFPATVLYEPTP